ncbi:hypothetical protein C6380_25695 [Pseudomonas syringae pv. actinidiae]|nr:hypothetical protein C6379_25035 [Pseudomonas syringae pv. actinidiae]RJX49122.1 hypothetical protein C6380_25695 [Pseudomonas syringae pv. actinidiae]RJY20108.1 hypothetical protein C6381_26360 [Pseudomonas syringae pv. actinidiae]
MKSRSQPKKAGYANQHYVPRLLLKRFTGPDEINIGLMNALSGEIKPSVPYKPQCAKYYFYGKDLLIEKELGKIENEVRKIIREISSISDPHIERFSRAHMLLTIFSVYQYVRTEKALKLVEEVIAKSFSIIKDQTKPQLMLKLAEEANGALSERELSEFCDSLSISITNPHFTLFETANKIIRPSMQLEMKLLINNTNTPFLISDNPLIYMNDGNEDCFYRMLLPLTPNLLIAFYDGKKYKIGSRKKNLHKVTNELDIFYLNVLQYLNCNKNIYFSPQTPVKHLISLNKSFKKFRFSEASTLIEFNFQPFLKTNRPTVNHRFTFAKQVALKGRPPK